MGKICHSFYSIMFILLITFTFCFAGCDKKIKTIAFDQLYNYTEDGEIISLTELGKNQTTIEIPEKINDTEIKRINYLGSSTVKNIIIKDNIEYISMGALRDNICLQSLTVPFLGNPTSFRNIYDRFGSTNSFPDLWYFFTNPIDQTTYAKTNEVIPKTLKHINITGSSLVDEIEIGRIGGYSIESISLPEKFIIKDGFGFGNCVKNVSVNVNNTKYDSRDNCNAIIETKTNTLIKGCINSTIPNSVTTIGKSAFSGIHLKEIIIPSSVTTIKEYAFYNINTLENTIVFIPSSVKEIDQHAFGLDNYSNITGFIFEQPEGWKIGNYILPADQLNTPTAAYETLKTSNNFNILINTL